MVYYTKFCKCGRVIPHYTMIPLKMCEQCLGKEIDKHAKNGNNTSVHIDDGKQGDLFRRKMVN